MNPILKQIQDNAVNPAISQIAGSHVGTIIATEPNSKTYKVRMSDGSSSSNMEDVWVPMIRQQGFHEPGPFVGNKVVIGFLNNNFKQPVIVGTIDYEYPMRRRIENDRHARKGDGVSDFYTQRSGADWSVD